jgi:transketolase
VATLEEHVPAGGLGSAVAEALIDKLGSGFPAMLRLSLPDRFMHNYGSQDSLLKKHGLSAGAIATSIEHALAASRTSPQLHST